METAADQTPAPPGAGSPESTLIPALAGLKNLVAQYLPSHDFGPVEQKVRHLRRGLFRLVVMGEIKKGKSSFINALLGEPSLLPTDADVATSTIYKILWGPARRIKVFFYVDPETGKRAEPRVIEPGSLAEYGTEKGNPANVKGVDFIGIEVPNPLLKDGLVIVDTPGVGGLFRAHRAITWRYAPNADAVAFALDSVESVIGREEVRFLKDLTAKFTKRIFFIQTKIDAVEEEQWQAWRDRNRKILEEEIGPEAGRLPYFPLSAVRKQRADRDQSEYDLQESGFLPVLALLQQQLPAIKKSLLGAEIVRVLLPIAGQLEGELTRRAALAAETSREKLDALAAEVRDAQNALRQWTATQLPRQRAELQNALLAVRREAAARLRDDLDPDGKIAREFLDEIRRDEARWNGDAIATHARELQQQLLDRAFAAVAAEQGRMNEEAVRVVEKCLGATDSSLDKSLVSATGTAAPLDGAIPLADLHLMATGFDTARSGFMGGTFGAGAASGVVTLLAFLIPPLGAAAAVASVIGAVGGGMYMAMEQVRRQREEALRALQQEFGRVMRRVGQKAFEQLENSASKLVPTALAALETLSRQKHDQLRARQTQIQAQSKASEEENAAHATRLDTDRKTLARLAADLGLLQQTLAVQP